MIDIIKNRIYFIKKELKKTNDCHPDIKYRINKTLNYLDEVYNK